MRREIKNITLDLLIAICCAGTINAEEQKVTNKPDLTQ